MPLDEMLDDDELDFGLLDADRSDMEFRRFPTGVLPRPVAKYIKAYARALGCDDSAVALPVLSVLGSAVGSTRRIRLKQAWSEPACLWTAVVAGPDTSAHRPMDAAARPLWELQNSVALFNQQQMHEHEQKLWAHRMAFPEKKTPPPEPPKLERFIAANLTVDTLVELTGEHPRGLMVCRDDLDVWFSSIRKTPTTRCPAGIASMSAMHDGRPISLDRPKGLVQIQSPSVSLTGGIQKSYVADAFRKIPAVGSLFSRLLIAAPPVRHRKWTDEDIDAHSTHAYDVVVQCLLAMEMEKNAEGVPVPLMVELDPEARERFIQFVNEFSDEQDRSDDALSATMQNLESTAARLALVVHLARWTAGETSNPLLCDGISMKAGITLARWFAYEARRIHRFVVQTPDQNELQQLLDWVDRRQGQATPRELMQSTRSRYPTSKSAMDAMDRLVEAGLGVWEERPAGRAGGRPSQVFVSNTKHETHKTPDAELPANGQTYDTLGA